MDHEKEVIAGRQTIGWHTTKWMHHYYLARPIKLLLNCLFIKNVGFDLRNESTTKITTLNLYLWEWNIITIIWLCQRKLLLNCLIKNVGLNFQKPVFYSLAIVSK